MKTRIVVMSFLALASVAQAKTSEGLSTAEQQELLRTVRKLEAEVKELRAAAKQHKRTGEAQVRIEMEGKAPVELRREDYAGRSPGSLESGGGAGASILDSFKGLKEIGAEKMGELQDYLKKLQQQRKEMDALVKELDKDL